MVLAIIAIIIGVVLLGLGLRNTLTDKNESTTASNVLDALKNGSEAGSGMTIGGLVFIVAGVMIIITTVL